MSDDGCATTLPGRGIGDVGDDEGDTDTVIGLSCFDLFGSLRGEWLTQIPSTTLQNTNKTPEIALPGKT